MPILKFIWRLLKWMTGIFFLLLTISLASIYFLLGTETGYRHLPGLINRFTPITIEYDALQGAFFGKQRWENLHIRHDNGLHIQLADAELDLHWQALLSRHVHIRHLSANHATIHLPESAPAPADDSPPLRALPDIRLPVDITLDEATVSDISIRNNTAEITHIDHARLHASLRNENQLALNLQTDMTQFAGTLEGELQTRGDYPLELKGQGELRLPEIPNSDISLTASGSVLKPVLDIQSRGGIALTAKLQGDIDLATQALSLQGQWQDAAYGKLVQTRSGTIAVQGPFDQLHLQLDGDIAGEDIPPAQIRAQALLAEQAVRDIDLDIQTLGGTIALQGHLDLQEALAWDARLQMQGIDGRRFRDDLDLRLDADIDSQGRFHDGALDARLDIAKLAGSWQDQPIAGEGKVQIRHDYIDIDNLRLELAGNRLQASGSAGVDSADLQVDIVADKLHNLIPNIRGDIRAQGRVHGSILSPQLDIDANWRNLQLQGSTGDFQDLPPGQMQAQALLAGQAVRDIDLDIQTLGGTIALQGHLDLQEALVWDARLQVQGIDGRRFRDDLDLRLDADIDSQGRFHDGILDARLDIAKLAGSWQDQPIAGEGKVQIRHDYIDIDNLRLELAGNRLQANGSAGVNNADLHVDIAADKLHNLIPNIRGDIRAQGRVNGSILSPQLDIDANWHNLQVQDGAATIVESSVGSIRAQGPWQTLAVELDGKASGRDFPPLHAKGRTDLLLGANTGKASNIDLDIDTLNGKIKAQGEVIFLPELAWDIRADSKGIEPQGYIDNLQGKVDAVIIAKGKFADGKLEMDNRLENLGGEWQGQKLAGLGNVSMQGDKLLLDDVKLDLGGNQIEVDGHVQGEALDIRFALDGKNLANLYPDLRGKLNGKGHIKGTLAAPEVQANLKGSNLAFADYQVASLAADIDSSLKPGGALNNRITLGELHAAGQTWSEIRLDTAGRFDAHTLQIQSKGGDFNVDLAAKGGLENLTAWKGSLERLQVNGQGLEWRLQKPAALALSPQNVSLKDFCLADQYSGLCLSLQHSDTTLLTYDINKIDPRSFKAFIPDIVSIDTALNGKGQVRIDANGKMLGDANIRLTPGRIVIRPPKQAPITLTLREGLLESAFTANEARNRLNIDFAESGKIQGNLVVKDYRALNLNGELNIHIPDIGRFAYLVPKVSEMKGQVNGELRIGGSASKPVVSGQILMDGGAIKIPEYATDLHDIRLRLKAERSGQIDINGNIGTPEGNLDANGTLYLSPLKMQMKLAGERMLIANSKTLRVLVSPKFDISIDPAAGIVVNGEVHVPEARIDIPDTSGGESISEDVIIVNEQHKDPADIIAEPSAAPMRVDIALRLGDKVYFANKDVKLRLIGGIDIAIRPGRPVSARGTIEVASGYYELYGQELNIKRGRVTFSGGNIANPAIDVLALREVGDVDVGARVSGTAQTLRLDLTSDPAMPDSAILSYLLFGRAPDGAMDSESLIQTAASIGFKGVFPDDLAEKTGLDVFDLGVSGLKAGKYLSEDIYVGMRSNFFTGLTEFLARYQFNKRMSMEITASGDSTAVDFLYQFEKD